jgi:hypothetical protein
MQEPESLQERRGMDEDPDRHSHHHRHSSSSHASHQKARFRFFVGSGVVCFALGVLGLGAGVAADTDRFPFSVGSLFGVMFGLALSVSVGGFAARFYRDYRRNHR